MKYVMMYCKNDSGKADKQLIIYPQWIVDTVIEFFQTQIAIAAQAGIHREQIILDPGMGAFVSQDPDDSIRLLQAIPLIKKTFDLPIHICTSRKWFLGKLVQLPSWERGVGGDLNLDNWPADRVGSSLATTLFAAQQGADYLRVHDVRWTRQGIDILWKMLQ